MTPTIAVAVGVAFSVGVAVVLVWRMRVAGRRLNAIRTEIDAMRAARKVAPPPGDLDEP